MYNRCTTPRPRTDVPQAMANNLQRKAFSYISCTDLYGSPNSDSNSSIRLCVHKRQKLVGPVVPCTPGVRLPDHSRMFTRRWRTICSKRHFGTHPVQIPKSKRNSALWLCVHNLYQTGRSGSTLYNRCMTPRPLTDVHQAMANNLQRKAFLYSSCTNLYGSMKSDRNSTLRLCVYNLYQTGRSRRTLYNRCTTHRPLSDVHQPMANNLQRKAFSHTSCTDLYGSPKSDRNSSIRQYVYKLQKTGWARSTLYTMCTTPRPLMDVHQAV